MYDVLKSQLVALGLDETQAQACVDSVEAAGYAVVPAASSAVDAGGASAAEVFSRTLAGRPGDAVLAIAVPGAGHLYVVERSLGAGKGSAVDMVGLKPGAGTGDPWA